MLSQNLELGQVVLALSGREQGRLFFIIKIVDNDHVLISDGRKRKLDKPKLKKVKHLRKYNFVNQDVKNKIESKESITDAFLRAELNKLDKIV